MTLVQAQGKVVGNSVGYNGQTWTIAGIQSEAVLGDGDVAPVNQSVPFTGLKFLLINPTNPTDAQKAIHDGAAVWVSHPNVI